MGAAAGIATIVAKIPREKVTVVMDGSLVRAHPFYIHHLESMMETLMKLRPSKLVPRQKCKIRLITDGAIKGAGIAAACQLFESRGKYTRTVSRLGVIRA